MEKNKNYFNQKNSNDNLIYQYAKNKLVTLMLKNQISKESPCSKYEGIYYIEGIIEEYKDGFILFKKKHNEDYYNDNLYYKEPERKFIININNIISIDINDYNYDDYLK